jgi:hypothetical protein
MTTIAGVILALLAPGAEAPPPQDEAADVRFQDRVHAAITRGVDFLKGKRTGSYHQDIEDGNELILLTLLHAGVPRSDADLQDLLKAATESRLEKTYKVALTAMCFEKVQRVEYQWRILQCAQFLADNVSPDGQTRYGLPTTPVEEIRRTPTQVRKPTPTNQPRDFSRKEPERTPVEQIVPVKQKRPGPADHDHSNMQYAALGLRACHEAGIRFEPELLRRVEAHWRKSLIRDAGAREDLLSLSPPTVKPKPGPGRTNALVAFRAAPAGWGYQKGADAATGAMTAGAVGALCILQHMQNRDWRQDRDILQGLQWINRNFSVTENPGRGQEWYYYFLYGLERAGMLYGTEIIGNHRWYREGAEQLFKDQKEDGGWGGGVVDTCFAILFLKRATERLPVRTGQ